MATIGLCMIVKNEAHIIERCLESVRPLIDYVLICDTGSTDATREICRAWLAREGVPGLVADDPWQDFAHNRTRSLARLRDVPDIDYALVMDADDILQIDPGVDPASLKAALDADLYSLRIGLGPVRFHRPQICRNALPFSYRGVLHEFLESPPDARAQFLHGLAIDARREGARSADPDKYAKDARTLEAALAYEQDPFLRSRYHFYLAQSYRDAGLLDRACEHYEIRATLGFWTEEVFISLYRIGQIMEAQARPVDDVIAAYLRAADQNPARAEALHAAARLCRLNDRFAEGCAIARRGLALRPADTALFVDLWIYDYGLLDEFAVNAYWAGAYRDSLDACIDILLRTDLDAALRARVEDNARFARARLTLPWDPAETPAS